MRRKARVLTQEDGNEPYVCQNVAEFEDAGTLSGLLSAERHAISRARQRHRTPDPGALTDANSRSCV